MSWTAIIRDGDLGEGQSVAWCPMPKADVRGRDALRIALYRWGERYHAIDARCPHYGGPLEARRVLYGGVVECPWHDWRFELATGRCENFAGQGVQVFPVRVSAGWVEVSWAATDRL